MAETHLYICAHLGDEFRYLSPGLARSVRSGARTVVLALTDQGVCAAESRSHRSEPATGPAADRGGVQRAFADLAADDPAKLWKTGKLDLPGMPGVATAGLDEVLLVFAGLHAPEAEPGGRGLDALWRREVPSLTGPNGPVERDALIGALAGLIGQLDPSLVRLLDPDAEHLGFDDDGNWIRTDDLDHLASALFGLAALELSTLGTERRHIVECHRGRTAERWPAGLDPDTASLRARSLALAVGQEPQQAEGEADATGGLLRFTPSTQWLTLDGEGRLFAVAPLGGRVRAWRQGRTDADGWEPVALPELDPELVGGFAPTAETVTALDGRVYVFGQRLALGELDHEHSRTALVAQQQAAGAGFPKWIDLGGPNGNTNRDSMRRRLAGPPRGATALSDGGVQFFNRNYGNGVSSRRIVFGRGWSHWLDFGGDGPDGASAVTALDGTVDLAAPGDQSIRHWVQDGPLGGHTRDAQSDTAATATPLTLVDCGGATLALLTRESPGNAVVGYLGPQGEDWGDVKPVRLGEAGGHGPVAAALDAQGRRLALATRSAEDTVVYAWWDWRSEAAPQWRQASPTVVSGAPALALDARGTMVLALLGTDGTVHAAALPDGPTAADPVLRRVG